MIAKLSGTVDHIVDDGIILNVNGIGFLVHIPSSSLHKLEVNQSLELHTEMLFRQDGVSFYGFSSLDEKVCFTKLINVQGVGGKSALSILSALSPANVYQAVQEQNKGVFQQADGIGPKVATRLINELADYARKQNVSSVSSSPQDPGANHSDVVNTLVTLGYKKHEAQRAVNQITQESPGLEEQDIVAKAIQKLSHNVL